MGIVEDKTINISTSPSSTHGRSFNNPLTRNPAHGAADFPLLPNIPLPEHFCLMHICDNYLLGEHLLHDRPQLGVVGNLTTPISILSGNYNYSIPDRATEKQIFHLCFRSHFMSIERKLLKNSKILTLIGL